MNTIVAVVNEDNNNNIDVRFNQQ